ncbi:hypothetical protein [Arcanobacterium buesumense]|uniref:Uncharacterized protein n=1 Tax=Arcanobacterium buesumense TaxID=2722751 RepID=A0A6H2ENR2_9ACTO|nr:hypothetical protein [Arcanobacterium buesumense]QJC22707.1 hypothetical protein HC352_06335 [Arcanobacterium buesumense]
MRWLLKKYVSHISSVAGRKEQGDVPGWVMITLMTAALVVLLWSLVGPALTTLFQDAISRVTQIS